MGIGEWNEGNDGNAENQGGNTRNHGGNVGNQCWNARNRGGNIGNAGNVLFVKEKPEWRIGEPNEGNDRNAENQGGNMGSQDENDGNTGNKLGTWGIRVRMMRIWGIGVNSWQ